MKVKVLFFLIICCISLASAQSVAPHSLQYNGRKLLCKKGTRMPYSGQVLGILSPFRVGKPSPVNIANVHSFLNYINFIILGLDTSKSAHVIVPSTITRVYLKGELLQGKETGKWQYYTEDNTLMVEADFVNGVVEGNVVRYYPDGTIESSTQYKKGKADGMQIRYYRNGEFRDKSLIKNGVFVKELAE